MKFQLFYICYMNFTFNKRLNSMSQINLLLIQFLLKTISDLNLELDWHSYNYFL